jgi:biopolymer transport protein TolR
MPSGLEAKLRAVNAAKQQKEAYLRADRDVPYGVVTNVMTQMRKAGIDRLGMVTEPVDRP